jgi:hypothetical protein
MKATFITHRVFTFICHQITGNECFKPFYFLNFLRMSASPSIGRYLPKYDGKISSEL